MNVSKLFLIGAVALGLGLTACNKNNDEPIVKGDYNATVSVKVMPSNNSTAAPQLKSAGNLSPLEKAESAIKTLEVYIFAGETPDGYGKAISSKENPDVNVNEVIRIKTHAGGNKTIMVVANAGFGEVSSKKALLDKRATFPIVDLSKGLVMTGETQQGITINTGDNQYGFNEKTPGYKKGANQINKEKPLSIARVNARVAIVGAQLDKKIDQTKVDSFDKLTDVQVAMFNVPQTSKLFGKSLFVGDKFFCGAKWKDIKGDTINDNFMTKNIEIPITSQNTPYFYVTENNNKDQMFIVLRGKPTKDGKAVGGEGLNVDKDGYTYYPIFINAGDKGYTFNGNLSGDGIIRRNTQYNITLNIKRIGNPGVDPAAKAFLDVLITVENWKTINQNVDF